MKKLSFILASVALMLFVISCDKIDINNTHKPINVSGHGKTVLIKDFTGVRCVNCPAAAETAHELQHQVGEDYVFVMSVHAGPLAQPSGQFPDFTTPEGTEWYRDNSSNPLFSVDHVALTDGNTLYVDQIDAPVADALDEPKTFDVSISNIYDTTSRQLTVASDVKAIKDVSGDFYVTVCLLEDSLVGWQLTLDGLNREYVFRNVFRGTLNGANGEAFTNGEVPANTAKTYSHTMALDSIYNAEQCYSLTYVYEKTDGKIMQTAVKKIK